MASATLVPVSEYLSKSYEPDCDYVDGIVEERNVGEKDHSKLQTELTTWLNVRRQQFGIRVFVEQRIRVSPTRYRVPDICAYLGSEPDEQVFITPPFLCVEILSPDDRMSRMLEKIQDYLGFGVRYVWIIDPRTRMAEIHTLSGIEKVRDGLLRTSGPEIAVPLPELLG